MIDTFIKQQRLIIIGGRNNELSKCNRRVWLLCNQAAVGVYYHGKCHEKSGVLFSGGDINTYLQSFGSGYGVDSKNRLTTVANAMDKDKEYYVCANYKDKITESV